MTEQKQSFEPIKQARIFEEIASQIRRQLATGKLKRGDKLPAERELAVHPMLLAELGRRSRQSLLEGFAREGIPCGEVLGLCEALRSPRAKDLLVDEGDRAGQPCPVLASPYRFDGQRLPIRANPPELGEHTNQVLESFLSLDRAAINVMRADGVIR